MEPLILIHVRFGPNGKVSDIGERPPTVTAQAWYDTLSIKAAPHYQPLSGGRGVFRLERQAIDALKEAAA